MACTSVEVPTATEPIDDPAVIAARLARFDGKQLRFSTYIKGKSDLVPQLYSSERLAISYEPKRQRLRIRKSASNALERIASVSVPRDTFTTVYPTFWDENLEEPLSSSWTAVVADTPTPLAIGVDTLGLSVYEVPSDSLPLARVGFAVGSDGRLERGMFDSGENSSSVAEIHYELGEIVGLTVTV